MRHSLALAALVAGLAFGTAALAATVTPEVGEVSINLGSGFQRIGGPVTAGPGTLVTAGPGSSGLIIYDDGCRIPVGPGEVVRVEESACGERAGAYIVGGALLGALAGFTVVIVRDKDDPASP